jgi:4'-phosphopantetheinyl transferase
MSISIFTTCNSRFQAKSMCTSLKVEIRDYCGPAEDCVVPDLQPDVVNVWTRSLRISTPAEARCYELLSTDEQERAARYRIERPRNDFIETRCTLRVLLARYLGTTPRDLTFEYSEYGKPLLNGACDVRFNVSHTDGLALMAFVKKREIGIDVEKIRPGPDARKLAERFFSVEERRSLENLSGTELQAAFFRCWTRKEAYIKAKGEGLSLPLHQFDVSVAADEPQALLATRPDPSEADRWSVCDLPTSPGYAAALAVAETGDSEEVAVRVKTRSGMRAQN